MKTNNITEKTQQSVNSLWAAFGNSGREKLWLTRRSLWQIQAQEVADQVGGGGEEKEVKGDRTKATLQERTPEFNNY